MTISYGITMNSSSCILEEFYIRRQQLEAMPLCTDILLKKAHTTHLCPLVVISSAKRIHRRSTISRGEVALVTFK